MGKKTLFDNYEEVYEDVSTISQNDFEEANFFSNLIKSDKILNILDLGCAEGNLAVILAEKGHNVTASDISQNFLNQVAKLASKKSVKIELIKCNIEKDISQFNKEYDIIFFMDVIEHLKSPPTGLRNIRTILKDDGCLIINTPNVFSISRLVYYITKRRKLINYYKPNTLYDLHFQTYDYLTLEQSLNFSGFKVYELIPNKIIFPILHKFKSLDPFFNFMSRQFPFFSNNLLVKCRKEDPLNVDNYLDSWK